MILHPFEIEKKVKVHIYYSVYDEKPSTARKNTNKTVRLWTEAHGG